MLYFLNSDTYPSPFLQRLVSGENCCARRILLITEMDLDTKFVVKLHLRPEIESPKISDHELKSETLRLFRRAPHMKNF